MRVLRVRLISPGDAGVLILQAYTVKEELRSLLGLAGTNPERHVIRASLDSFYQSAAATDAPEVHRLAATVEAWWPAIETDPQISQESPSYRVFELQVGGLQPSGKTPGPQRFWVPQPGQPTSSDTVGMHPRIPAGLSREDHIARLSSKSLLRWRYCGPPRSTPVRRYCSMPWRCELEPDPSAAPRTQPPTS